MHFVLDVKVNEGNESAEEGTGQIFSQLDGSRVGRAKHKATHGPRNGSDYIGNHEDIMPVVIVRRCNVCPASAGQGPQDAEEGESLGKAAARSGSQNIP